MESILQFIKGGKLIVGVNSNSRSTVWHDKITNIRGKKLEEFVASHHLHVINEENKRTTFQSTRGKSNIDLTITNNQMLTDVKKLGHIRGRKRLGSQHNKVQH